MPAVHRLSGVIRQRAALAVTPGARRRGSTLACCAAVGLSIQAALAAAMLVFWVQDPASFQGATLPYPHWPGAHSLLARAGTPIFVAGLAAWVIGLAALGLARRRIAPGVLIGAGLLSAISYWLAAVVYPGPYEHAGSLGVLLLGLIPLACLVALEGDLPIRSRSWHRCPVLAALLAAALIVAGNAAANPYLIAGRITAPAFLAGLWAVGVAVAVIAGWRRPGSALAAALLNVPVLLIRSGNLFCCAPPAFRLGSSGPSTVGGMILAGRKCWVPAWLAAETALLLVGLAGARRGRA